MEQDLLDSLEDLGYSGPLLEDSVMIQALEEGAKSVELTKLVEWITKELSGFYGLEDHVNAVSEPDEAESFLMELSGFLREYGCPHTFLTEGAISQRLATKENTTCLLDFLLTELAAARMLSASKSPLLAKDKEVEKSAESEEARYLKQMLIAMGFPKPPEGITAFQLFSKVETKIKELLAKVPKDHVSKPILKARLSDKQWDNVKYINQALTQEYECRREMLLKRLDVTIQSFKWSDRAKQNENKMTAMYQPIRRKLSPKSEVDLHHLLAAREDLLFIQKTSSGAAREKTKCALNKVRIGRVPDRGGRAFEMEPPPPEMPGFQKRQDGGGRGGRGGGWSGNRGGQQWGNKGYGQRGGRGGGYSQGNSGYGGRGSSFGGRGSGYGDRDSGYGRDRSYGGHDRDYGGRDSNYGGGRGRRDSGDGGYWKQNKRSKYY